MKFTTENGNLVIALEGEIRSDNAENVKEEIMALIAEHPDKKVFFDASTLKYISSAGLRVLLMVEKEKLPEKVTMRNVSRDIYDILEIAGITTSFILAHHSQQLDKQKYFARQSEG